MAKASAYTDITQASVKTAKRPENRRESHVEYHFPFISIENTFLGEHKQVRN